VPAAPELPSTTTLVVTSVGARDAGLLVDAAGAYSQAVPRPAPPWALELDPPSAEVTTCGPVHDWTLRVRNVADDACGLFPAVDDISLAGTSDLGDGLVFTPPAVALGPGDEADVRVRWQRQGPPRDPGVTSSITITATSGGAAASGDVVIATSALRVVAPDDDVPGPLAPGLRVSRQGADVALAWAGSADVVGGYEVVAVTCDVRDACAELPAKNVLDARGPRATTAPGELATMFAGAAEAGQPALEFYKVRATSPCRGRPGSTCPFTCTDPRRCDGRCR
jgi:hypothetical protein